MIEKIFYINLDRRQDRNINVLQIMKKYGMNATRISAIDGTKLDVTKIPNSIITEKGIHDAQKKNQHISVSLTMGAIGCALSHRNVWKKIIDENIDNVLILEDDIRFDSNFGKKLDNYANHWPKNYDVIFLGYHPASIKFITKSVNDVFTRSNNVYGTFGYVVSKKGAEKLLKIFPLNYQIDTEIHRNFHNIDAYLVKPNYRIILSDPSEFAKDFGSDIQKQENFCSQLMKRDMNNIIYIPLLLVLLIVLFINSMICF